MIGSVEKSGVMQKKLLKYLKAKVKTLKVFDWVLIGVALVAVIIFAVIFFRKTTYITATISVGEDSMGYGGWWDTGPKKWLANSFYKGQKEKDGLGRVQAEVLDIFAYDKTPARKSVYLKVKLNTVYNRGTNTYTYKGMPVLVGSLLKLDLENVHAEGYITEMQGFPSLAPKQTITVEAQIREDNPVYSGTSGTKDYVANALQTGDKVYDNNGNPIITVRNVKVVPAEASVPTSDGRLIKTTDPLRKDVFLTLEVVVQKAGNNFYFLNDIPIIIDQQIPINTSKASVFAVVTRFVSTGK